MRQDLEAAFGGGGIEQLAQTVPCGWQHEFLLHEVGEGDWTRRQQLVARVGHGRQRLGGTERQARHVRQAGFHHCDPDQAAHDPVLQHGVGRFLDHQLQRRMPRLDLQHGFGDAIDQEAVLIDRRQDADRDAPARRRGGCGAVARQMPGACLDQGGDASEALATDGWNHAVALALEQRAAERRFELVQLLAQRWLTDVDTVGRGRHPPQPLHHPEISDLPQADRGAFETGSFRLGQSAFEMAQEERGDRGGLRDPRDDVGRQRFVRRDHRDIEQAQA